jgi:signal peptidase I
MSTIYRVPSGAMKPTLALGQRVEVDEDAYHASPPVIGDIVVFYAPLRIRVATCSTLGSDGGV